MAQAANVKRLFLTHIRKHMDVAGHLDAIQAEAAQYFTGEIAIAEDLMAIEIYGVTAHNDYPRGRMLCLTMSHF